MTCADLPDRGFLAARRGSGMGAHSLWETIFQYNSKLQEIM